MSILLQETYGKDERKYLDSPIIDGENIRIFKESLLSDSDLREEDALNIINNGASVLKYFVDPAFGGSSKILCVGKVQSGKTSFFLSATAFAFDNSYSICFLCGETKNDLKKQNIERVQSDFSNNENVIIKDINDVDYSEIQDILKDIEDGKKYIFVILKQNALEKNIGRVINFLELGLNKIPSIFIDDEGDEYTPGAPHSKRKGITHDKIAGILRLLNTCTFLSVTATPEANFLINIYDEISPDFFTLVYPGSKYIGGIDFHDNFENSHIRIIDDSDDFGDNRIPSSFYEALYFFIMCCAISTYKSENKNYSFMVHPSSLNRVQKNISEKIIDIISFIKEQLESPKNKIYEKVEVIFNDFKKKYPEKVDFNFEIIKPYLTYVVSELDVLVINSRSFRKGTDKKFGIYVGGNILGRGLTIPRLIVTYIYRDAKIQAVDTLYQRARWLGYK